MKDNHVIVLTIFVILIVLGIAICVTSKRVIDKVRTVWANRSGSTRGGPPAGALAGDAAGRDAIELGRMG